MQRLEVSCAVRLYIYIYVVRRQNVKHSDKFTLFTHNHNKCIK